MSTRAISIWPVLGRKEINERSEQSFTVRFLDNRALSAPGTARYKLTSLTNGEEVIAWTSISTPTSEETVVINSDKNTIRCGFATEHYELTVQSDHDDVTEKQTASYRYKVVDVEGVTD